jgi:riboflavin synthase
MFTGLVETRGRIRSLEPSGQARRLVIEAPFAAELQMGESVNVDGACQSVTSQERGAFSVTAVPETLKRTKLGLYRSGEKVNLERALRLSDRLGGHLVSGHIDCLGRLERIRMAGADYHVTVSYPAEYAALVVAKGSVALDGISLTVVDVTGSTLSVAVIPLTWQETTLGERRVGDPLNIEFDLIGKYLLRFRDAGRAAGTELHAGQGGWTRE